MDSRKQEKSDSENHVFEGVLTDRWGLLTFNTSLKFEKNTIFEENTHLVSKTLKSRAEYLGQRKHPIRQYSVSTVRRKATGRVEAGPWSG